MLNELMIAIEAALKKMVADAMVPLTERVDALEKGYAEGAANAVNAAINFESDGFKNAVMNIMEDAVSNAVSDAVDDAVSDAVESAVSDAISESTVRDVVNEVLDGASVTLRLR